MRTTHERERSEFRRSRCESAQKNAAANRNRLPREWSLSLHGRYQKDTTSTLLSFFCIFPQNNRNSTVGYHISNDSTFTLFLCTLAILALYAMYDTLSLARSAAVMCCDVYVCVCF